MISPQNRFFSRNQLTKMLKSPRFSARIRQATHIRVAGTYPHDIGRVSRVFFPAARPIPMAIDGCPQQVNHLFVLTILSFRRIDIDIAVNHRSHR